MNLVVTGATGGGGSWLVDHFASESHAVRGADRDRPPGERWDGIDSFVRSS